MKTGGHRGETGQIAAGAADPGIVVTVTGAMIAGDGRRIYCAHRVACDGVSRSEEPDETNPCAAGYVSGSEDSDETH